MMVDNGCRDLGKQPVHKHALASVQKFEMEARLACAPDRIDKSTVTCIPTNFISNFCFTPDGKRVVFQGETRTFLWDLSAGKCIQVSTPGVKRIETMTLTPDGQTIVTGDLGGAIRVLDMETGVCVRELTGHQRPVQQVITSPDGREIVSRDCYAVGVWDLANGERLHWIEKQKDDSINDIAVSADGKTLYLAVGKVLRLLDLVSGDLRREIAMDAEVHQIEISPDGQTVIIKKGSNFQLECMDMRTGETRRIPDCPSVYQMALGPTGKTLATSHKTKVCLWELETGEQQVSYPATPSICSPLVFSPDGTRFIFYGKGVFLCDLQTGTMESILKDKSATVRCSGISSNGRVLVTEVEGDGFNLWDLRTGKSRRRSIGYQYDPTTSIYPKILALSPDGKSLVLKYDSQTIQVWDIDLDLCVHVWQMQTPTKHCNYWHLVTIDPESRLVAYNDGQQIVLRKLNSGMAYKVLTGHEQNILSLTFSRDSRYLVSSDRETLRKWDVQTGLCLQEIQFRDFLKVNEPCYPNLHRLMDPDSLHFLINESVGDPQFPKRLYDPVTKQCLQEFVGMKWGEVIPHPDGKTFFSLGSTILDISNDIHQWDLETGQKIRTYEAIPCESRNHEIKSWVLCRDGNLLVGETLNGLTYFWDTHSGDLLATAYNLTEGYLWTTPPDDFAPNGWLHTDRPDLVSLQEVEKGTGGYPEFIPEGDERFRKYMQLYNDGDMVMARLNDRDRYRELLRLRLGSKTAMQDRLLVEGREMRLKLTAGSEEDLWV